MYSVLVAEGDHAVSCEIGGFLSDCGYNVSCATNSAEAWSRSTSASVDLLILDRSIPGADGLEFLTALRRAEIYTPAILLSAMNAVDDRVHGLRAGSDDYLGKPVALRELQARVEALLRRQLHAPPSVLQVGSLRLDLIGRTAWCGKNKLDLLPREFQILEYMMRRRGETLTRAMLFAGVWNYNFMSSPNLIDVHVGKLRRKLNANGGEDLLCSVKGFGFILDDSHEAPSRKIIPRSTEIHWTPTVSEAATLPLL